MKFLLPYEGETRDITKFAWYPIRVKSCIYWLETVTIHQMRMKDKWRNLYTF